MGNATGREDGGVTDAVNTSSGSFNGDGPGVRDGHAPNLVPDVVPMVNIPPQSPSRSRSPHLFAPQVIPPLQRVEVLPFSNNSRLNESQGVNDGTQEKGVPTVITWTFGGNSVAVEGSWDNWKARKILQRSGKDHSVLLVLPSGIYHYKIIVDGESRYIPDLPYIADGSGHVCNLLDVSAYVPENLESVAEFEAPPSPESSYSQSFFTEDDFAKEPALLPPQLYLTVAGKEKNDESSFSSSSKPPHVVINHLFMEKGWASQSVVAVGLTHRFQSKYVTVVLYKPLKR
jgi:5'-AMP-activated protein kinase regulatory beta subunit